MSNKSIKLDIDFDNFGLRFEAEMMRMTVIDLLCYVDRLLWFECRFWSGNGDFIERHCVVSLLRFNHDDYDFVPIFRWLPLGNEALKTHISWVFNAYKSNNNQEDNIND